MLTVFKSKASADLIMYQENAQPILDMLGKQAARGIITSAEMAGAISGLEAKIAESKAQSAPDTAQGDEAEPDSHVPSRLVPFAVRAFPLLEVLRAAQKAECDVVWGV